MTLLENFRSHTVVNGHLPLKLLLERGCREGDPIAGYLFILAIEVLLPNIFHEEAIQGHQTMPTDFHPWSSTSGTEHLIDGYAYDLSLFLKQGTTPKEDTT